MLTTLTTSIIATSLIPKRIGHIFQPQNFNSKTARKYIRTFHSLKVSRTRLKKISLINLPNTILHRLLVSTNISMGHDRITCFNIICWHVLLSWKNRFCTIFLNFVHIILIFFPKRESK